MTGATARPASRRVDQLLRWAFLGLCVAAIVLPMITSGERVHFRLAGFELQLRFLAYFAIAGLVILISGVVAISAVPGERRWWPAALWQQITIVYLVWLALVVLATARPITEWLPTVSRLGLYLGCAFIAYRYTRTLPLTGYDRLADRLLLGVLAVAAVPALVGGVELITGSAPILNGARRISGTLAGHPVAFSLVVAEGALATVAAAIVAGRSKAALWRWIAVVALVVLILSSFTRLTIVLTALAGVAIAALLFAPLRVRLARAAAGAAVAVLILVVATSYFEARLTYLTPLSELLATPAPSASATVLATPAPSASATVEESPSVGNPGDIEVDTSVALRVLTHQWGLKYIQASPVIGSGPGSFSRLFERDTGRPRVATHDDALLFAVEQGIPGLLLYAGILGSIGWALRPRPGGRSGAVNALVVVAPVLLFGVNVGAAIHNPTYFPEIQLPLWILVGCALGIRSPGHAPVRALPG